MNGPRLPVPSLIIIINYWKLRKEGPKKGQAYYLKEGHTGEVVGVGEVEIMR